jgi:hypothetical protein
VTESSTPAAKPATTFDPGQHLSKIKGQDYLEVKWRLAWIRAEHPDASITTDLYSHENGRAIFHAHVSLPAGGSSTGWGSETADTFENYIEKAETKAIGRALAALGFGTQFCDDFNDNGAIADAPVTPRGGRSSGGSSGGDGSLATSAQKSLIQYKARQAELEPEELIRYISAECGKGFNELTKRDASSLIDKLGDVKAVRASLERAGRSQASGAANPPSNRSQGNTGPHRGQSASAGKPEGSALANPGQISAIERLGAKMDLDLDGILGLIFAITDREIIQLRELTSEEAGAVITEMQKEGA